MDSFGTFVCEASGYIPVFAFLRRLGCRRKFCRSSFFVLRLKARQRFPPQQGF